MIERAENFLTLFVVLGILLLLAYYSKDIKALFSVFSSPFTPFVQDPRQSGAAAASGAVALSSTAGSAGAAAAQAVSPETFAGDGSQTVSSPDLSGASGSF